MAAPSPAYAAAVGEITKIYKSLPPRPSIEEVEAAISVVKSADAEEEMRLEEISKQVAPRDTPPELFTVLQELRKAMVVFQGREQRREAVLLIEVDKRFRRFDQLIRSASEWVSGVDPVEIGGDCFSGEIGIDESGIPENEDGFMGLIRSCSSNALALSSSGDGDKKFSLMKVAEIIENFAKTELAVLDLQGKLMDKVEWLPLSLGKLCSLVELNLSDNRIMALPSTINALVTLTKLDIHSNQFFNLPDCIGELINLTHLDLHANWMKSLPPSFGNLANLINLDLSSNHFATLPDVFGSLVHLQRLNLETNELEEVPCSIGSCISLVELRLDFNRLNALPEAVGEFKCLEILTLRYNRVSVLPTSMGNLLSLKELDVCFNEIHSIPEALCSAVCLEKLNVASNFSDLTALPESIGKLENLEELDITNDQIKTLPDSFRFLSKLRIFRADETPLEEPPMEVTELGAKAVVEYMADYVAKRDMKAEQQKKKNGFWPRICPLFSCFRGD
ncbi:PREDICTED: plant intracellular Ras-group-related LRR protein 5-like [Ipomoea nil]|uniref:plant intracellular Ras-group-related LRR protein 5-like n=1 Tax=Ipomoea nil TaxID=35883 RepID=UPI000900C4C5|nr:PREDICTED: plant intracellular Ras-group-related LRR protein 5-like [Ipomoea nil]